MESWKSVVVGQGPFRAELGEGCNGWWIVVNAHGDELSDSGDGGFLESSARAIADSLNQQARIEELEATVLQMGENTADLAKYYQARIAEIESTALQMVENTADLTKYYQARFKELEADKAELEAHNSRLKGIKL